MKKRVLNIVFCFGLLVQLYAQSDCSKKLKEAQLMLDRGDLYNIPSKLDQCIKSGFSKEEKVKAYALLVESHLYLGENQKAEEAYLEVLRLKPLYEPYEEDAVELHDYHERFTTKPIFNFPNIKLGINRTTITVLNDYLTDGQMEGGDVYTQKTGIDLGIGGDVNIFKGIYFSSYLMFRQKRFEFETQMLEDNEKLSRGENQLWLEIPLGLAYSPDNWKAKLTPIVSMSYVFGILLESTAVDIKRENIIENINEKPITGPDITLTSSDVDQRVRSYNSINFSIGAKYRINEKYLALDVSYQAGLNNLLKVENQYSNNDLIYKYGYVDDDFKINNIAVSLTFINPIYFPRVKKAYR